MLYLSIIYLKRKIGFALAGLAVLIILLFSYYAYREFTRTVTSVEKMNSFRIIESDSLIIQFMKSDQEIDSLFRNQVIEIVGLPTRIIQQDSLGIIEFDKGMPYIIQASFALEGLSDLENHPYGEPCRCRCYYYGYVPHDTLLAIPGVIQLGRCRVIQ